ncbi:unnamed protein product, partial [Callosobruchus maculatus]
LGLGFGAAWGYICSLAPERNDPFAAPLRVLLLLAGGMGAVYGGSLVGYGGAGPLGCVAAGFVAICMWSRIGWDVEDNPAATAFEIFWMIFQPILFGITGARVKINELKPELLGLCLGVLITAIVIRMAITIFFSIGCKLNNKEKIFVSIAWMCKAIVQAALGPVALSLVPEDTDDHEAAEKILMTCILSIILTAPTGALLLTLLGPHLLTKATMPTLKEVRMRKKSRRLSIRDLTVPDTKLREEDEENHRMSVVPEETQENYI